jgi:hypothetical protein
MFDTLIPSIEIQSQNPLPVKWAFPRPGLASQEIAGETYYVLTPDAMGKKMKSDGYETALILFTSKILLVAEQAQLEDHELDVDKFLAAIAVTRAVETPSGFINQFIRKGKLKGVQVYLYRTKTGAPVAAAVSADRRRVLVMQVEVD